MNSNAPKVARFPVSELWTDRRPVRAIPVAEIDEDGIRRLLSAEPGLRFVVAEVGRPLRWVPVEDRFTFWKLDVKAHLVPIPERIGFSIYEYPEGYAYLATEWVSEEGDRIVVLERHH